MDPWQYLPDSVARRALASYNGRNFLAFLLKWFVVLTAWAGLISSVLSIFSYAAWVIDSCLYLYEFAAENAPKLVVLFDGISAMVDWWRSVTHPVRDFLFGWLPFNVPRWTIDVTVILTVSFGGFVRAWFATRQERRFAQAISPQLSPIGRVALLKRMQACMDVLSKVDETSGSNIEIALADKAERELVLALDELTEGARTKRRDDEIIDSIMDASSQDITRMAEYLMLFDEHRRIAFQKIFGRAIVMSSVLSTVLVVDIIYRAAS